MSATKLVLAFVSLTLFAIAAHGFQSLQSDYSVLSVEIKTGKKICGELLQVPKGVVVHKVTQEDPATNHPQGIRERCMVQFVVPRGTSLQGQYFEMLMHNFNGSISATYRHKM